MQEENCIIADVRSREEYEEWHVINALNIPHNKIESSINLDKNKLIKVYCKSGMRSSIAAEILKAMGYRVENLGAYDEIALEKE